MPSMVPRNICPGAWAGGGAAGGVAAAGGAAAGGAGCPAVAGPALQFRGSSSGAVVCPTTVWLKLPPRLKPHAGQFQAASWHGVPH